MPPTAHAHLAPDPPAGSPPEPRATRIERIEAHRRLSAAYRLLAMARSRATNADTAASIMRCWRSLRSLGLTWGIASKDLDRKPRFEEARTFVGSMVADAFDALAPLASDDGAHRTRAVTFLHKCFLRTAIECGTDRLPVNLPERPSTPMG